MAMPQPPPSEPSVPQLPGPARGKPTPAEAKLQAASMAILFGSEVEKVIRAVLYDQGLRGQQIDDTFPDVRTEAWRQVEPGDWPQDAARWKKIVRPIARNMAIDVIRFGQVRHEHHEDTEGEVDHFETPASSGRDQHDVRQQAALMDEVPLSSTPAGRAVLDAMISNDNISEVAREQGISPAKAHGIKLALIEGFQGAYKKRNGAGVLAAAVAGMWACGAIFMNVANHRLEPTLGFGGGVHQFEVSVNSADAPRVRQDEGQLAGATLQAASDACHSHRLNDCETLMKDLASLDMDGNLTVQIGQLQYMVNDGRQFDENLREYDAKTGRKPKK